MKQDMIKTLSSGYWKSARIIRTPVTKEYRIVLFSNSGLAHQVEKARGGLRYFKKLETATKYCSELDDGKPIDITVELNG